MARTTRDWIIGAAALATLATGPSLASAQMPATSLSPVDYTFIGLTYLGNQFQVDSGKLGETRAANAALRSYAALMDTSHVAVENRLVALLHKLGAVQPPASLLSGAYKSLTTMLAAEHGAEFDRDYVRGQIDYQNAKRCAVSMGNRERR